MVIRQFRLHLHRGIAYLATPGAVGSIADLVKLAAPDNIRRRDAFLNGYAGEDEGLYDDLGR